MNISENEAIRKVHNYLIELNYPENSIRTNVRIKGNYSDYVVYDGDHPFIVIEIKKDLPDLKELRFDPSVSQLQLLALSLNSPYYLLTNGDYYLWF